MKKWIITIAFFCMFPLCACAAAIAKLPYVKGQSFIVTQGYNTSPTHIKKDAYALDFTQNGCDAYGKGVVAAASGKVMFLSQEGYNGGYGTELIIDHGQNLVTRYAHMVPDSITVGPNDPVHQGQTIGLVGDTGLVAGMACAVHPGTHLHFAMDAVASDGTFTAYNPEPISGYVNMTAGMWYLSDNDESDVDLNVGAAPLVVPSVSSTTTVATTTTTTPISILPSFTNVGVPIASVSATSAPVSPSDTSISTVATSTTTSTPDVSSSTSDHTTSSSALFEQADDTAGSPYSFYDDNWYDLGNGFSGTLDTLTLEGKVSDPDYFASHVWLQEFKDENYTAMVQQFTISEDAPFTDILATATFSGLSILLKPYFYYRLATSQDYQNRSVILMGTASTTIGVAMAHNFIYGTGGVETTSTFFPYMVMEGERATSTLTAPPLSTPTNLTETFDSFGMQLNVSFSTSTDPDWPANPLRYQMNYSTSTTLSDNGWTDPEPIPLALGNSYLIGIRAKDDYGDTSAVATATWNFPAGFAPYLLSPNMNYASQYFTVPATSTLQSIQLFTTDFETNTRYPDDDFCSLQLFDEYDLSSYGMTQSDNGFNGFACANAPVFSFVSSSPVLYPDHRYHWVFGIQTASPLVGAGVRFYGTATDTAGGAFNDSSLANAKFTVTGNVGVLFSN